MNPSILEQIVALERDGRRFAIATIVEATGSVPGKLGARMVVHPDGAQHGTVGGAGLEERVKRLARETLAGQHPAGLHRFDLARQKPGGLDSICGGSVAVFIEIMNPRPHLVLFGGGHVGQAIATLCDFLGYHYTVCDDRADFTTAELFPGAVDRVTDKAEGFFDADRDLARYTHLYVLGYSHQLDEGTLAMALERFPGAVGLIGSRAKRIDLRARLAERGIAAEEFDRRVTCPIGLPIGAETPHEIAVAVLGEVIASYRHPPAAAAPETRQS